MQETGIGWKQLFAQADIIIQKQLLKAKGQGKALLLQPRTRSGSLLLLAVGMRWPHEVILDEKNLLSAADAVVLDETTIGWEALPAQPVIIGGDGPELSGWEHWRLVLCTSGSTGEPKQIVKSGAGLLAEVRDLARLYGWNSGSVVLSLVSPLHIYGLLHSFLLPLYCRSSVEFVSFSEGPVDPASLLRNRYTGVVAVPATWNFVKDLLQSKQIELIVMSGAPFGDKRRQELQDTEKKPDRALEILGSTETGGLGYRSLLGAGNAFQPLRSVRLGEDWVESPYLLPETRLPLADRLELLNDGSFLHRGRVDRIFKYAGQRYALGEVEKALSQSCHNVETFVRFHIDEQVAQGGWLEAWIETSEPMITAAIRAAYRSQTRAPFPHRVHFQEQFPRDAQGKLQILRSIQDDVQWPG